MPNHKTHDIIGVVSAIPVAIVAHSFTTIETAFVLSAGVIFSTYYLSPDLDLHSKIYRRWGILRFIWFPYMKLIPHRSFMSHSGPISATIRLAYLALWFLPLTLIYSVSLPSLQPFLLLLWISATIADTIHVLADKVCSEL